MVMANYLRGKPIMQDYIPSAAYNAGDVIVIGDLPLVAHSDNPLSSIGMTVPSGPSVIKDALAVRGGIYQIAADAAYPVGCYVYWDPSGQKVTGAAAGNAVPFGWIVGGPSDRLDDGGPTGSGSLASVLHAPEGSGGVAYGLAVTANDNITNTNTETAFTTSSTIPAATLVAGDIIHVRAGGIVNAQNGADTNTVKLRIGTAANTNTTVINTGAVNAAANAVFLIEADLIFSAVGASGSVLAVGDTGFGVSGTITRKIVNLAATAINTNLAVPISVSALQSTANTGNVIQLLELTVEKKRK